MNDRLALREHFQALTTLLLDYDYLWRPVPFYQQVLTWESAHPALARALRQLDDKAANVLEADNTALIRWLTPYLPSIDLISDLQSIPTTPAHAAGEINYPSHFGRDIPGRKWQQIQAYVDGMSPLEGAVLEWCAGKAHLGRAINYRFGTAVTGLEWDANLCKAGTTLSETHNVDVHLQHCDVLSPLAIAHLQESDHAVALHACGDLHRCLIETVAARGIGSLHLSPCCYHLVASQRYSPFSSSGRACGLQLSREDCRLAVRETVTSAAVTTQRRHKKNAWRLGFDTLQRQLRGIDKYLAVPPLADALLKGDFADFCKHTAALKAIELPPGIDWHHFETAGWQRQAEVSRLELPRHAFRRVLELWLVLDRALLLEESGYRVAVTTFCERQLTPRNLMITAVRE